PNIDWPEACEEKPSLSAVVRAENPGGGELVDEVNTTPGGIGYAALPDAIDDKTGSTIILKVQNNGQKGAAEATFGNPAAGATANCSTNQYKTPANVNTGTDLDWSQVFGAQPAIGGSAYPLCTLTSILAFHGYEAAGFPAKDERTVKDYIRSYITQTAGQEAINSDDYAALPSG